MKEESTIRLTGFSHGAGCGCKIAPAVLSQIIQSDKALQQFPNLLVGNSSKDDAAVFHTGNGQCVISTTDFFMPIVDDPFDFGRIASANAISDVYAMGGMPLMAIAILGWPVDKIPAEVAADVLQGSRAVCAAAGIPLAGGHSIDSPEPFFGLAVTGTVHTAQLRQNNTAQEGDLIFLTKPIGTGILSTTQKRVQLPASQYDELVKWMTTLNNIGPLLANLSAVHAMTDVTGFGLMGHLLEMCEGSGLGATLNYNKIQTMKGAREWLQQKMIPGATKRNWNGYGSQVEIASTVDEAEAQLLLPDPQTNGGLLIAVHPAGVEEVQALLQQQGLQQLMEPIGIFTTATSAKRVLVV